MFNKKLKVSVVITHYNKERQLHECIHSIYKYRPKASFEIIVVDNGDLKKRSGSFKYIKSPGNIGYGAGNNLGVKNSKGEYILILNPDTKFIDNSIEILIDFLDKNKEAFIVSPNLIDKKGNVFAQLGSRKLTPIRGIFALSALNKMLPNNPISKSYWLMDTRMDELREVDVVPGSAILIRKGAFMKVNGFDEKFFLYFEESDLCKRLKEKFPDKKIFINPNAKLIHDWKPKNPATKKSVKIFKESRFYYFRKHYGILNALMVEFFTRLGKKSMLLK